MDEYLPPPAPETLGNEGRMVWENLTIKYRFRHDELLTLEDACAASDMIRALSDAWAELGRPLTSRGSQGQEVIHPLIGEIRTQRAARNAIWRQLKIPDDAPAVEVNQQRDAVNSRWATGKGRGQ